MSRHFSVTNTSRAARAALVTLALGTLVSGCSKRGDAATATSNAVTVGREVVAVVANDTIESGPGIQGTLAPEREAKLRAQVPGPVLSVSVLQGARVGPGTVLGQLDDRALKDAFLSARSGVTTAQIAADNAARDLERSKKLVAEGAVSDQALEAATRSNLQAQAQLADAKARLQSAQDNLDRAKITAPFSGVVSEKNISAGDVVTMGGPLFTVVDPSTMRLEASVPAEQLGEVRIGALARFTVSGYGDRQFTGRVNAINPTADPVTRQVRIYITIPNGGNQPLVGGLFAEGRVASAARPALVVPETAVDRRGVQPFVLRLKGGKAEQVQVTLGLHDKARERFEVTAGLTAGDTLLIGAARGISAGTPVVVSTPSDKPTN
jgi:RND family efflux transporter MFP subunit